ncbi:MAG: HipA N-terminal domain-containing protein [Verrucomicrobiales bacterium]|jgi:serine/threonine-protein kinase HipA|nr:HipA N-terminal domain-containing protein [Verrucomicrobiales bacterium]
MAKVLDVYLQRDLAGHLTQDAQGDVAFAYADSWLSNPQAIPLSHSLPLNRDEFPRKACGGFFSGILPEEGIRRLIARNLGISPRNDFAMLEQIGGECAGAVTFIHKGEALPELTPHYRELSNDELLAILRELPKRPLMAGDKEVRLSLAGAQNKMAMKIGGEYVFGKIGARHFEKFAEESKLAKPIVKRRVLELAEQLLSQLEITEYLSALKTLIKGRCERVMQKA